MALRRFSQSDMMYVPPIEIDPPGSGLPTGDPGMAYRNKVARREMLDLREAFAKLDVSLSTIEDTGTNAVPTD